MVLIHILQVLLAAIGVYIMVGYCIVAVTTGIGILIEITLNKGNDDKYGVLVRSLIWGGFMLAVLASFVASIVYLIFNV